LKRHLAEEYSPRETKKKGRKRYPFSKGLGEEEMMNVLRVHNIEVCFFGGELYLTLWGKKRRQWDKVGNSGL